MSDARLSKATDPARQSRAMEDRAVTERKSKDDYKALLRAQMYGNVLPDLPKVEGYHVCWLTTTGHGDTLARRQNEGYVALTLEDVPGWTYNNVKGSAFEGWPIACNEMVAGKIPQERYEAWMETYHHDLPQMHENGIRDQALAMQEQVRSKGGNMEIFGGEREGGHPRPFR